LKGPKFIITTTEILHLERKNLMKKIVALLSVILAFSGLWSYASPVFSDSFSDPNGALLGQSAQIGTGAWTITGSSVVNPIQVNNGMVTLTNTGQDAYAQLSSPVSTASGGSIFVGLDLNVSAAQANGDYFLHFTTAVGATSGFYDKLWVQSSGSGFVLGIQATSGTTNWGSSVLSFGTSYRVVTEEDFVSGAANDTFDVFVNPTDLSVAGNNTPYATLTWNGAVAEASTYAEINFRQGTASIAPIETVDNLVVSSAFSDVSAVPEPSSLAFGLVGGFAWLVALRRKG
jgi:hypothetical protein